MTAAIRYTGLINTTGALITEPTITLGDDLATQVIMRKISAAEIGTGKGQTQDATDPKTGLLFAKCYGPPIQAVTSVTLMKPATINQTGLEWEYFPTVIGDQIVNIAFAIDDPINGASSIYILDNGTDDSTRIVDGDVVLMTIAIGSADRITAIPIL